MSKVKKIVEEVKADQIPELDLVDKNISNILEIPGLCEYRTCVWRGLGRICIVVVAVVVVAVVVDACLTALTFVIWINSVLSYLFWYFFSVSLNHLTRITLSHNKILSEFTLGVF